MTPAWHKSLAMGLLCMPVGAAVGAWVALTAIGGGYGMFIAAAPIASLVAGTLAWWLMVARSGSTRLWRAALAGMLASILGHLLCWYLLMLGSYLWATLTHQPTGPGGPPMNPLQALPAAAVFSAWSLLFVGWFTVPVGGLLGVLLLWVQSAPPEIPKATKP